MKKQVLLLMTGLLFACSGAFAQQEWEEFVVNGDFEGSDFSSFSIKNSQDGSSQDLIADNIVVDDDDANNHCAKVTLTITPRSCHFIIKLAEPLSEGDMLKFSMRAKTSSEKDVPIRTENMGNIVVKTGGEWSTFTYEGVVSSELAGSQAITLSFGPVPRKNDIFYFDDISMKVTDGNVPIEFADAKVKEICVSNWDSNGDGELSYAEAAAVGSLGEVFRGNQEITCFNELQYFIGLGEIGYNAFMGSSLTSVIIPNNVSYIGQYAFEFCYSLTSVTLGHNVKEIGGQAFYLCRSLTTVTIPNSVTSIGFSAFCQCGGLTSVTIPKSVTSIGYQAFQSCWGLTSIIVESGNAKYDSRDNCNALIETESNTLIVGCMNTVIPSSVTTIGSGAFYNCSGLTSVTIPSSVSAIEDDAFHWCSGLTSIEVESGNTKYDSRSNCNAIIETETNTLFAGCMNTIIPNTVTTIGNKAFFGCTRLTSVTIPNSVTTIGDEAFTDCNGLASIKVESGNTRYDSRDDCNAIIETETNTLIAGCMNTIIPNSVTSIGNWAFEGNIGLTSVTIPNSVTTIGNYAFSVCRGLEEVTIGSGVTSIGSCVFEYCRGLKEIHSMITEPSTCKMSYDWLSWGPSLAVVILYVPAGTKEKYESTPAWKLFQNIVEMEASSGIAIDATNFPDENFRNWVLAQDYGQDGVLTDEEIANVTDIDVSSKEISNLKGIEYFTALRRLYCHQNQLTELDVSHNTALTRLRCYQNQLTEIDLSNNLVLNLLECSKNKLTELDVSLNTALSSLSCYQNQLTELDVSHNTALSSFWCDHNQLTELNVTHNNELTMLHCEGNQLTTVDVSKNTALTSLDCSDNQLTSLDVSKNVTLTFLDCNGNQLTSLDVSKNVALNWLCCNENNIKGVEMDALVASLPMTTGGKFYAISSSNREQNVVTKAHVAAAKEKGWTTYYNAGGSKWLEYEGSEPELIPVEEGQTIDIGNKIDEGTNLEGTVVDKVFVNISNGDGGFDPAEGCLIVSKPTDDSAINGKDIFGDDFKDNYTGIVFKVNEGKGSIKVEAETQGNMVLKVKIGNSDPIEMELDGKLKVKFPYNVSEPTYVYIYGGMGAAGAKAMGANRAKSAADLLKIYGFEIVSDPSGIDAIENGLQPDAPVYNLNGQRVNTPGKGVYIKNGRKVLMK